MLAVLVRRTISGFYSGLFCRQPPASMDMGSALFWAQNLLAVVHEF